jgi:hypothetical protein
MKGEKNLNMHIKIRSANINGKKIFDKISESGIEFYSFEVKEMKGESMKSSIHTGIVVKFAKRDYSKRIV